ncbi:hypothetical protein BG015_006466 [Linnemannia schmuckeri]|uniref:Peptidase S12 Pab87-related C-terminal domain-containing protein n=1 Tax=Linnemannia schmuckeri TaxID=64567 RepID=A0A9P5UUL7_9FUNG|nr:hypothetical protein BG015_006466 [Linnemannia schmuckeri]
MVAFFPYDELVVSFRSNAEITDLSTNIPYYIADGILNLPQTVDWLNDRVLNRTKYMYDLHAKIEKGNFPDRIEGKPNSHPLIEYTGEYTNPVFGKIAVTLQEDGPLFKKVRTLETKLEHYHYESFEGYVQAFAIRGNVFFTFYTRADGRVDSLQATHVMGSGPEMYKKVEAPK